MIISICNQKGGVTKTTTTLLLAHALKMKKKKVLIVDFDPQSSLTISCGVEPKELTDNTMFNVLCRNLDTKDILINLDGIHLLPASIELSIAEIELTGYSFRESTLRKKLEPIKDEYDYILIDCPPSLGVLTINALTCSDYVLIPSTTEYLALRGIELLLDTIEAIKVGANSELAIMGIVPTMHDNRTLHAREVLDEFNNYEDIKIFDPIKKSIKVQDAVLASKTILETDPTHEISKAYKKLAKGVMSYG